MPEEKISISRKVTKEMDEPHITREVDRLVQIERRLADTPDIDGGDRSAKDIAKQALAIYRAMSGYDFCGALEGALEQHARALQDQI